MEAFPATFLATDDAVLAEAIPAQLQHALGVECTVQPTWEAAHTQLTACPPAMWVVDTALAGASISALETVRRAHPLLGIIAIGTAGNASPTPPGEWPLCAWLPRPLSMSALVRQYEQLVYERRTTAGNQHLPLTASVRFHPAGKQLLAAGEARSELTDKEVGMLLCLFHHRGQRVARQTLLEQVWGYGENMDTHTLETHLYRLRQKLKDVTGDDSLIETAHGTYRLKMS